MADEDNRPDNKRGLKQYIFVIRQLASKELKHGNASKNLGQLWNIIMPFVSMLVMAILFAAVFHQDLKEFMPFVFTGTIVLGFFDDGMNGSMNALSANKSLLIRTKIPGNVFVVEKIYVALFRMLFSLVGYAIILIISGVRVGPAVALAPVGIIIAIFMILGIGKMLAVINVFFADISYFYKVLMRLVMYASGIFYTADKLSPVMGRIIEYNPIYLIIYFERSCILYNHIPEPVVWVKILAFAAGLYLLGTYIFKIGVRDVVAKL